MFAITLPAEQRASAFIPVGAGSHCRIALQIEQMVLVKNWSAVDAVAAAVESY